MRSRDFKEIARESLRGNWFKAIVANFIYAFFCGGVSISTSVSNSTTTPEEGESVVALLSAAGQQGAEPYANFILGGYLVVLLIGLLVGIITSGITGSVAVGFARFNSDLTSGGDAKIGSLFSYFGKMFTVFWMNIIMGVRIFLGTLLFIIPGIVMSFNYAMVHHVLADNPDLTAREALAESKRIMKGNRWRYFCLSFSFIGLNLLIVLTLGIAAIWVVPYENAAFGAFYNEIKD